MKINNKRVFKFCCLIPMKLKTVDQTDVCIVGSDSFENIVCFILACHVLLLDNTRCLSVLIDNYHFSL